MDKNVDTIAKIIEISAQSEVSFQDAIERGITRANQTLKGLRGAWVKEQEVTVEDGKIAAYRVILKVTFVLGA